MKLRLLYYFTNIYTFDKIKNKEKAITTNRTKENIRRRSHHTTLAESITVIIAIAPPLRFALYVNSSKSNHSDL